VETGWNTTRTLGSSCHNRNARQSKTSELACLRRIYLAASGLPATLCVFYRMLTCSVGNQHRSALLLPCARVSSSTQCIVHCCSNTAGALRRVMLPARSRCTVEGPCCRIPLVPPAPELLTPSRLSSTRDPSWHHWLAVQARAAPPVQARGACCSRCRVGMLCQRCCQPAATAGCCC
jgi:hypothetical protein